MKTRREREKAKENKRQKTQNKVVEFVDELKKLKESNLNDKIIARTLGEKYGIFVLIHQEEIKKEILSREKQANE